MENTTVDEERLLQQLNDEKAVLMLPVIIYLVVLMIIGLFGNAMVCFYYGFKSRQSSNTVFIIVVAMYDLMVCGLSIPIEIVDIRLFYLFTNSGACKFLRFINYFAAIGSACTLLVISVDRYRKICKPFKKQLNIREAKIACGVSVLVTLVLSWPALVFYGSVKVDVPSDEGITLVRHDCTTTKDGDYKIYLEIFNAFYLICFLVSAISVCVLYSLVCRVLFKHNKSKRRYSGGPVAKKQASGRAESQFTDNNKTENKYTVNAIVAEGQTGATRDSTQKSISQPDRKNVKFTTMMLVITVVYILSFLPHLSLSLWRAFVGGYEVDIFSDAELVAFQIGLRSYFLNSAINPFVYGFFNSEFRQYFFIKFCPCNKRSEFNTISTSSGST